MLTQVTETLKDAGQSVQDFGQDVVEDVVELVQTGENPSEDSPNERAVFWGYYSVAIIATLLISDALNISLNAIT